MEPGNEKAEVEPGNEKTEVEPGNEMAEVEPGNEKAEEEPGNEKAEVEPGRSRESKCLEVFLDNQFEIYCTLAAVVSSPDAMATGACNITWLFCCTLQVCGF